MPLISDGDELCLLNEPTLLTALALIGVADGGCILIYVALVVGLCWIGSFIPVDCLLGVSDYFGALSIWYNSVPLALDFDIFDIARWCLEGLFYTGALCSYLTVDASDELPLFATLLYASKALL